MKDIPALSIPNISLGVIKPLLASSALTLEIPLDINASLSFSTNFGLANFVPSGYILGVSDPNILGSESTPPNPNKFSSFPSKAIFSAAACSFLSSNAFNSSEVLKLGSSIGFS